MSTTTHDYPVILKDTIALLYSRTRLPSYSQGHAYPVILKDMITLLFKGHDCPVIFNENGHVTEMIYTIIIIHDTII